MNVFCFLVISVFKTLCGLLMVVPGFSWLFAAFCLDLNMICLCFLFDYFLGTFVF